MEYLQRYRWGITVVLVVLTALASYLVWKPDAAPRTPPTGAAIIVYTPTPLPTTTPAPTPTPAPIVVYVSGAVVHPGVYALPADARLADAIEAAGGTVTQANLVQINLARRMHDEEHIHVPVKGEPTILLPTTPPAPAAGSEDSPQTTDKVNINTAGVAELDGLPGIGPGYAQRIVDYRDSHGPFQSIEEIQNVPGIGPSTFARIREFITVGP